MGKIQDALARAFPEEKPPEFTDEVVPAKFAATAVADPALGVRIVNELTRARKGSSLRRYRVRCDNYPQLARVKYVLATSLNEAKAVYLRELGIDSHLEEVLAQRERDVKAGFQCSEIEPPKLTVVEMAD